MTVATCLNINHTNSKVWSLVLTMLEQNRPIGELLENLEFQTWANGICKRIFYKYERAMKVGYGESYDADDLFVDTCCNLLRCEHPITRQGTRDSMAFTSYYSLVAQNVVISKLRKKRVRTDPMDGHDLLDPRIELEREQFCREFTEFANRLSAKRREIVLLRTQQYSTIEIAEMLGCSLTTVKNHIRAAVKDFLQHRKVDKSGN